MAANDASPSRWSRRATIIALACCAVAVASYLALFQLGAIATVWDPIFGAGSQRVLTSFVSRAIRNVLFVPDSFLGAVAYAAETVFAAIGSSNRYREHPRLVLLFGATSAALAAAGLGLVALQAFVLHTYCFLCLVSAASSLTIAVLAFPEVRAAAHVAGVVRVAT